MRIIAHKTFGLNPGGHITSAQSAIVWNLRLPRALLAFCAGAALSVSGAVMQSVLRNPLASSYTLGVSSGASLGASLVIFMGVNLPFLSMFPLPLLGFLFGLGAILMVMAISRQLDARMENHTVILTGMVFALFINAVTTLMFALFREGTQRMILWQMGSFSMRDWPTVYILAPAALAGVLFTSRFKWELDVMTFGEDNAQAVGVNVRRVKLILLITAAALTGSAIAFVGVIGFVDLAAPHIARKIFNSSHRYVIPMSAVIGGAFMVLSDLAARIITPPVELPVGAVTAILGAPFFAYIFFSRRKKEAL
jgi:iron complex transport system permease protein